MSKNRLGKGMGALLQDDFDLSVNAGEFKVIEMDLEIIIPNPEQPRKDFSEESLQELANSIKEKGIIQPIIVERYNEQFHQIIAGERRFRAAKLLGNKTIPVIIREFSYEDKLEIALIENIQREDLNAIEEAMAYHGLMDKFNLTQDEVAKKVGKSRATVANSLRLLKLPKEILDSVVAGDISAGHARAILSVDEIKQRDIYLAIKNDNLSVRAAENMAKVLNGNLQVEETKQQGKNSSSDIVNKANSSGLKTESTSKKVELVEMEEKLMMAIGSKVQILGDFSRGKIEIQYYSMDDLERICEILHK